MWKQRCDQYTAAASMIRGHIETIRSMAAIADAQANVTDAIQRAVASIKAIQVDPDLVGDVMADADDARISMEETSRLLETSTQDVEEEFSELLINDTPPFTHPENTEGRGMNTDGKRITQPVLV